MPAAFFAQIGYNNNKTDDWEIIFELHQQLWLHTTTSKAIIQFFIDKNLHTEEELANNNNNLICVPKDGGVLLKTAWGHTKLRIYQMSMHDNSIILEVMAKKDNGVHFSETMAVINRWEIQTNCQNCHFSAQQS